MIFKHESDFCDWVNHNIEYTLKVHVTKIDLCLRQNFGKHLTITSGLRSVRDNQRVNGAKNSAHLKCPSAAVDLRVSHLDHNEKMFLMKRIAQIDFLHAIDEGNHIHLQLLRRSIGS